MKKCVRSFSFLAVTLAGCAESVESISREYRNANNEAIDAMMMVINEEQAVRMKARVFLPLRDRYQELDRKLASLRVNRTRKELARELSESEGVKLYVAELAINRQRFDLETTRLRNLLKQTLDHERQKRIDSGEIDPQVDPGKVCPILFELAAPDVNLAVVCEQLKNPKIMEIIDR